MRSRAAGAALHGLLFAVIFLAVTVPTWLLLGDFDGDRIVGTASVAGVAYAFACYHAPLGGRS